MSTKIITFNGKPYSNFVTSLRRPDRVLKAWRERMAKLGGTLPDGEWGVR